MLDYRINNMILVLQGLCRAIEAYKNGNVVEGLQLVVVAK